MRITATKLATRCEICHQADLYNPQSNTCDRCRFINKPGNSLSVQLNRNTEPIREWRRTYRDSSEPSLYETLLASSVLAIISLAILYCLSFTK